MAEQSSYDFSEVSPPISEGLNRRLWMSPTSKVESRTRSIAMNWMKWSVVILVLGVVLSFGSYGIADDAAKTISGKASCGGCDGVVAGGCCLLLTDKEGVRWVLRGKGDSLTAAFNERKSGKTMTATLSGEPVTKKGKDGKDYKEIKVSEIKIGS